MVGSRTILLSLLVLFLLDGPKRPKNLSKYLRFTPPPKKKNKIKTKIEKQIPHRLLLK